MSEDAAVPGEAKPKRVQRFGPEVWDERGGRDWSLWDLWFCVVAVREHDGDLDAVAEGFVDAIRGPGVSGRDTNEAKLSLVLDLRARLADAGLTPSDLADDAVLADKAVVTRARKKVLDPGSIDGRAYTPAMRDTPRHRLEQRARYGHWPSFPSDPARFYARFRRTVERKDLVTKGRTARVVATLEQRLAELDGPRRRLPDRLALYRAFHTAGLELADVSDDSYGNIGDLRTEAWRTYLAIDWRAAGMDPAAYWQDLCELRLWEPFALDHDAEGLWCRRARGDDVAVVESVLLALEQEHRDAVLDYEADEALVALADLYLTTRSRDRFVSAARRLGSRAWRPIEAMARSQLAAGDTAGAVAVFRAADQPGWHRDHLRRTCLSLTGVDLAVADPAGGDLAGVDPDGTAPDGTALGGAALDGAGPDVSSDGSPRS